MKKILLCSICGIWLLVSTAVAVNGQLASNHARSSERFVISNKTEPGNSPGLVGRVDPPVIRSFLKSYKDVSDAKWIEVKEGFVAMFNRDGVDYQVAYTKKGNLIRTIRSYSEDNMSQDLRHIVKSTYYDYGINRVHEIETPLKPVTYIVQLVGKKELINLKIENGEMEEVQRFKQSK